MYLKIDTKEKFNEITVITTQLSANMTADFYEELSGFVQTQPKNVILRLGEVATIDIKAAETIASLHQHYYENDASFVLCELQPAVQEFLDDAQLLEAMNATPTLSEAWDMVQMEEIEREFLSGDEL